MPGTFGMTGPDEYTGVVDDNDFTNLMAAATSGGPPSMPPAADRGRSWAVDHAERAPAGRRRSVHIGCDEGLGVHPMNTNFTSYEESRFEEESHAIRTRTPAYAAFCRRQVLKNQGRPRAGPVVVRDDFTAEEVASDVEYYDARTFRDSSLSAAVQAVVSAHAQMPTSPCATGDGCALVDLRDIQGDTEGGLDWPAGAGAWQAFVAGLGGLREDHEDLEIAPLLLVHVPHRMPRHLARQVAPRRDDAREHHGHAGARRGAAPSTGGAPTTVTAAAPVHGPLRAPTPLLDEPRQPLGREPRP